MNNTLNVSIDCVPAALREFFAEHSTIALAFSGGTDSSYLLYAAKACGANVHAYYVSTPFQPQFELDDAKLLAESLHADMTVLPFDVLTDKVVKSNPKDRCYYCKNQVFGGILKAAKEDGFTEIMDGTNASDDAGDRPGMRALKEMKVLSPLRLSGITKTGTPGIFPKCRIIYMEQARLRLSCDESSVGNFHRSFCIKGCGVGRKIPL